MPSKRIPSHDTQVTAIMESFDFNRVARAMNLMAWTWGETKSPTPTQLRETSIRLFDMLKANPKSEYYSTGGLRVQRDRYGWLELLFVLEHWDGRYSLQSE